MTEPSERWCLYRWYDRDGWLLYVGITNDLDRRTRQHRARAWWTRWGAVVDEDPVVRCATVAVATRAELAAIKAEHPVFNLSGSVNPRDRVLSYFASRGIDPDPHVENLAALSVWTRNGDVAAPALRGAPVALNEVMEGPTFRRIPDEVDGYRIYKAVEFIDPSRESYVAVGLDMPEIGHAIFASVSDSGEIGFEVLGHSAGVYPWPPARHG